MANEVYKKLMNVQAELKAPKGQFNKFGGYKYRSCEDIMEAVKPLLAKNGLVLVVSDTIEPVGDRIYVKATADVIDTETGDKVTASAFARESATKKGMDDSQVTGATSSYARKYCLNGLFCIDDTKDADTWDNTQSHKAQDKQPSTVDDFYNLTIGWAKLNHAVPLIPELLNKQFGKQRFKELSPAEAKAFWQHLPELVKEIRKADDEALMKGV